MKHTNQVCTLEQAQILKLLGIRQKSLFYWQVMKQPVQDGCCSEIITYCPDINHPISLEAAESAYSAFTVAELGQLLGPNISYTIKENIFEATVSKHHFPHPDIAEDHFWFIMRSDTSEAEVRAGLLINLLQNNLLTAMQINARIN